MAISWAALGKDTPLVRGIPAQFDAVDASFGNIATLTRDLSGDLHEIRMGQSDGFAGEAADALHDTIGELYTSLSDVPKIATNISCIFRDHSVSLTALKAEAESALARAQTRWNQKRRAEDEVSACKAQLRSLSRQISTLDGSCDPMADDTLARLRSHSASLGGKLRSAERDLDRANDQLDHSRSEWDRIRQDENELNDRTRNQIGAIELWSLKDTGNFITEGFANLVKGIGAVWNYAVEHVLEQLHRILDTILTCLDVIGIVLEFIPGVNVIYKLLEYAVVGLKFQVGFLLVISGKMDLSRFLFDTAIDLAGSLPFVPRFVIKGLAKVAMRSVGIFAKGISQLVKGAKVGVDIARTGFLSTSKLVQYAIKGVTDLAGGVVKFTSKTASKAITAMSGAVKWSVRRAKVSWEAAIRYIGDTSAKVIRRFGNAADMVIKLVGKATAKSIDTVTRAVDDYIFKPVLDGLDTVSHISRELGDYFVKSARRVDDYELNPLLEAIGKDSIITILEKSEEMALGNSAAPARTDRVPVLAPCSFTQ